MKILNWIPKIQPEQEKKKKTMGPKVGYIIDLVSGQNLQTDPNEIGSIASHMSWGF